MIATRAIPAAMSLRACAARALVEIADRAGTRPPDIDALAKKYGIGRTGQPDLRSTLAAFENRNDPNDMALLVLASITRLDAVELLAVAILAGIEEDPTFVRAVMALQAPVQGTRPTSALLAAACAPVTKSWASALQQLVAGNARGAGVVTFHDLECPLGEQRCELSSAVYFAICDRDAPVPGATSVDTFIALPPSVLHDCARLAHALRERDRALIIRTASIAEGRAVSSAVARARNLRPLFLEHTAVPGLGPYMIMRGFLPVFAVELGPGERKRIASPPAYDGPLLVIAGREGTVEVDGVIAASWPIPIPPREERRELWRTQLGNSALASTLGDAHRHGAGRIAQLAQSARRLAAVDGRAVDRGHVRRAGWITEGVGLAGLAEPIFDEIPDDAMVTTTLLRRDLELLLSRCEAREGLGENLGSAVRARLRPGVRAMFVGPSGTGKTLAASWLATRLGLPLYRVDLSAVTSKYIGETEKNLAQLLARAEHEEVILLFDEADSMFGKRTDVKEANDRFANAQTNFLLQRIESFDGIVLLTSNSRTRIDPAFTRRLDAVIEFPLPGPEERRALWLAHLGFEHELDQADINRLAASVDLVGGHIRNAVLSAAVVARKAGRRIQLDDVITALLVEYRKLGRSIPPELQR